MPMFGSHSDQYNESKHTVRVLNFNFNYWQLPKVDGGTLENRDIKQETHEADTNNVEQFWKSQNSV